MSENRPHEVNLLDLIAFILRWRVFLITSVLSVSVVVAVISFVVPPKYRSTAVIQAQESESGGLGSLLSGKLGALGGIGNLGISFGTVKEEAFVMILKSRTIASKAIQKFDLRRVYRMPRAPIEDVIKILYSRSKFELDSESGTLLIYVDDVSATRARDMVQFFVDELDTRNQELKSIAARKEREYIGKRLDEEKERLHLLEDSMSVFQMETGVLSPEEQVKATIQTGAILEAQRMAAQIELDMNRHLRGTDSPEIKWLTMRIMSIDSTINNLIVDKRAEGDADILLRMRDTPVQGMQYFRYMRAIEIQQLLVGFLLQRYESARVEELRNTPTLIRIDNPVLAEKRIWPKRGMMVVVAAAGAFIFSLALALFIDFWRNASQDESNKNFTRINAIIDSLRSK